MIKIFLILLLNISLYAAVTCSNFKKQNTCENHAECRWDTIILFLGQCVDNTSPIANPDSTTTLKNTPVAINVTTNDTDDTSIDNTTVAIATLPSNGGVSVNSTTGVVTYTPNSSFAGTDIFTYTVNDNNGALSNTATVTITIILPIAEYRMDESSWNGSAGEVTDFTGTYNSTAASLFSTKPTTANTSPAISGDPGTCRYGIFNRINKDYIALPSSFPNLGIPATGTTGSFSITAWIKTSNAAASGQRIFIDDEGIASGAKGYGFSMGDGGAGKLRFYSRNTTPVTLDTANVIASNTWYFVAAVSDIQNKRKWIYVYNTAGTQLSNVNATWTGTSFGSDNGIASIGGETNSATEKTNSFGFSGNIDEVRVYQSALNASQLNQIRQETHACASTTPTCTSFQYDLYHTTTPSNKLYTRIASQPFDVNVTVACTGTGEIPARQIKKIYAVTGACPTATTGLPILWNGSTDINSTVQTITINTPLLNSTKAYQNIKLMLETNASEFNCSTDTMAIRPASFTVTTPTSLKAEQFTLTASATNSGGGYNGTGSVSTTLQTPNSGCPISSNFLTFGSTPLHFTADTNITEANATDVGIITLNLKDTTWTAVDQTTDCIPDSNSTDSINGKFGCNIETNTTITIIPHHFDVNATLSNAVTGFTYLSTDLNMSAKLDLNITAKNGEGNTTINYDKGCYAKSTTLTLPHSVIPSPLTKILYTENLSGINTSVSTSNDLNLSLPNTIFTQGLAPLSVDLNFDRNSSKPLNPFDFSFSNSSITDTDNVTGLSIPSGTATFVYGRARAYDIKTDQTPAPNPIEIEVYGKNSTNTFLNNKPQNVLYWYRNTDHDSNASGSILSGSTDVPTISINPYIYLPLDGLHPIDITYFGTNPITKTVHLDISPWLWYSPSANYSYMGNCTQHPCFNYQFFGTALNNSGVQSGTFQGADFNLTPAKTIIKKGVKVFR